MGRYVTRSGGPSQVPKVICIPDFINEVLLGERCVPFYGADWLVELKKHGLVQR
jgi:hypothetical protein